MVILILDLFNSLNSFENIKNVKEIKKNNDNFEVNYSKIYEFTLNIQKQNFDIIMCIPEEWNLKLIDFYIKDYKNIKFIPHLEKNGKICLFDKEGLLVEENLNGIAIESIERLNKVLYEGLNDINKLDFINEFDAYWNLLSTNNIAKSNVNLSNDIKIIKYKIKNNKKNIDLVFSDDENSFKVYNIKGSIKNAIYIPIKSKEYIYPPDWRKNFDFYKFCSLLNIEYIFSSKYINKCGNDLVLLINITQPNKTNCLISLYIKNIKQYTINIKNNTLILPNITGIPLSVYRCDEEYLLGRGGIERVFSNKKILVIGCGSIGGYLVDELVKSGFLNICLVDYDILSYNNIYRHLLGLEYIGEYKTTAIIRYLSKNLPHAKVISNEDSIRLLLEEGSLELSDFDLIISSTGDINLNRWLNKYIKIKKIITPVIYIWNEALGIGSHALYIKDNYLGCFECTIGKDELGIYDKTSYFERGQTFTKKMNSCNSTFVPYGSIHSVRTAILGVDIAIKHMNGNIKENFLISIKDDGTVYLKENLKLSNRYIKQKNKQQIISGENFDRKNCFICKRKT